MRKRAVFFSLLMVACFAGLFVIKSRVLLPEKSSLTTFAQDVRSAKRLFGNDYAGYLAAINRYGDQAFPGSNIGAAEQALKTQKALTIVKPFENSLGFTLADAEPDLPEEIGLRPKFWLHTDPLSPEGKVGFSYDCELALDESSEKVRQAMIRAGGFLKEVAERPGFIDLVRKNPTTLSGSLNYSTGNCFDLQMKFLSENLVGKSVRYVVQVLVEPEEFRYVSWLPITYRRAPGTIVKIENQGEELSYQFANEAKEVIRSLHREDLKYVFPAGPRPHYTKSLHDLDSLPAETEGIQYVPPIAEAALEKMGRFRHLRSLILNDSTKGGANLPSLERLVNLAYFAVEGGLSPASVDSLCRLPLLEDVNLDVPNLSKQELVKIMAISTLRRLYVNSAHIDEIVLEAMAANQSIEQVTFGERVKLSSKGVQAFGRMKSLKVLHIYVAKDMDLVPIYQLKNLEVLGLSKLQLAAKDINALTSMTQLQGLMLDEITGVTREQLLSFAKLKNLREFYFNQEGTPASDMRQLRSRLPGKWLRN